MSMKLQMTPRIGGSVAGADGIAVGRAGGIWSVSPPSIVSAADLATRSFSSAARAVQLLGYGAAGDGGDQLMQLVANGTGYTLPSADGKNWEIIAPRSVRAAQFGAKTDGSNAAAGIQKAIDFLQSKGGGVVFLDRGTYSITSTIVLRRGVSLIGADADSIFNEPWNTPVTVIKWTGAVFGTMASFGNLWKGCLANIYFDCNFTAANGLSLGAPQGSIFDNLVVGRTAAGLAGSGISIDLTGQIYESGPSAGQQFPSAGFNRFSNVIVRDMQYTALYLNGVVSGGVVIAAVTLNLVQNCRFLGGAGGFAIAFNQACDTNFFLGGDVAAGTGSTGILLNFSTANSDVYTNNFYGTSIENNAVSSTGIDARNNAGFNHFFGCHLPTQGTQYTLSATVNLGKVKFWGCDLLFGAPAGPVAGASPWTYTNTTAAAVEMQFWGGTVSAIGRIRNGAENAIGVVVGGYYSLLLEPGDGVKITHTGAPTVQIMPH